MHERGIARPGVVPGFLSLTRLIDKVSELQFSGGRVLSRHLPHAADNTDLPAAGTGNPLIQHLLRLLSGDSARAGRTAAASAAPALLRRFMAAGRKASDEYKR